MMPGGVGDDAPYADGAAVIRGEEVNPVAAALVEAVGHHAWLRLGVGSIPQPKLLVRGVRDNDLAFVKMVWEELNQAATISVEKERMRLAATHRLPLLIEGWEDWLLGNSVPLEKNLRG